MDISVIFRRKMGERRKNVIRKGNPKWKDPEVFNPYPVILNHRKHEGAVYREAIGGEEKRGKPRFHGDWFE